MKQKKSLGIIPPVKCKMKLASKVLFIYLLFNFITEYSFAQNPIQDSLQQEFDSYRRTSMQEKIFLHSDKEFYLAGEICWFKIYDVDASFHMPLSISKVAYVEVMDNNNKPILQAKISLKDGYGNGSFHLPISIISGKYKIRAYTSWMKNFSPDYFFEKIITIVNSQKIYSEETKKEKELYDVKFFPEGGNLVNGIQSKIAFRIVNHNGKGVSCEGIILNDKADTITKYATAKFGIGSFSLTPEMDHSYKAIISLPTGEKIMQALPAAFNNGYVMHLFSPANNKIKITVSSPPNYAPQSTIYLFVHTRNSVKLILSNTIQNGVAEFLIDKVKIGDGISHFTVFNSEHEPVCERLYFKYPEKSLKLEMALDGLEYDLRKKVKIDITSITQDGKPTQANMSMAVYEVDSLQKVDETNINNYLWLSSDLSGAIESPEYYFNNNDAGMEEAVDNLMLTHGWRRFRWENILHNKKPVFDIVPEYVGHVVTGRITKQKTGFPAGGIACYLSVPGNRIQFRNAISYENGLIKFNMKDFYAENGVIVQTNQQNNLFNIELLNPFAEKFTDRPFPPFSLDHISAENLQNLNVSLQVQKQYNGNKAKQFLLPQIDSTPFYVKPNASYLLDNYTRFTTMEEVLREYITGIIVRIRNGKFHLLILDKQNEELSDADPMVLLDGVPILDMDKIMSYDPLKVKKLDVVSRKYYFGNMLFNGILNFATYERNLSGYELDPHTTVIDYDGLQLQREFYSPIYETQQQVDSRMPDFRNLLFWSPELKTDSMGKQSIDFYTSDIAGKYAVVLQGLTPDGKTGSHVKFFEVKKTGVDK